MVAPHRAAAADHSRPRGARERCDDTQAASVVAPVRGCHILVRRPEGRYRPIVACGNAAIIWARQIAVERDCYAIAGCKQTTCVDCAAGCSGCLLTPSPPAEKATARHDQAGQASTDDGAGNAGDGRGEESVMGAILVVGVLPPIWPASLPSK